ncbi:hypothetical protein L6452_36418 [Arctium lappa]|uniref:Uncharacterized protein n=1 Tax=Arctium lappa TaxID=4217 RepID=A0ACB8YA13_ARCLA|nr:hypothetical protein L6452_36418 [Arctium lappa]
MQEDEITSIVTNILWTYLVLFLEMNVVKALPPFLSFLNVASVFSILVHSYTPSAAGVTDDIFGISTTRAAAHPLVE